MKHQSSDNACPHENWNVWESCDMKMHWHALVSIGQQLAHCERALISVSSCCWHPHVLNPPQCRHAVTLAVRLSLPFCNQMFCYACAHLGPCQVGFQHGLIWQHRELVCVGWAVLHRTSRFQTLIVKDASMPQFCWSLHGNSITQFPHVQCKQGN